MTPWYTAITPEVEFIGMLACSVCKRCRPHFIAMFLYYNLSYSLQSWHLKLLKTKSYYQETRRRRHYIPISRQRGKEPERLR